MGGKKGNADAPGKATISCSLNSLLATVEAIFNRVRSGGTTLRHPDVGPVQGEFP